MRVNLAEMSLTELEAHLAAVQQAIRARREADREIARRQVEERARELGFSVEELFGPAGEADGESRAAPKYADPRDPARTWSGRGRTPKWLAEREAEGYAREAMLIARG